MGCMIHLYSMSLHRKMKFSIKDFFGKWGQITLTEEILNGKLHYFEQCVVYRPRKSKPSECEEELSGGGVRD